MELGTRICALLPAPGHHQCTRPRCVATHRRRRTLARPLRDAVCATPQCMECGLRTRRGPVLAALPNHSCLPGADRHRAGELAEGQRIDRPAPQRAISSFRPGLVAHGGAHVAHRLPGLAAPRFSQHAWLRSHSRYCARRPVSNGRRQVAPAALAVGARAFAAGLSHRLCRHEAHPQCRPARRGAQHPRRSQ